MKMDNKDSEVTKSVWDDIKRVWGRIASVVAAVGIIATFIVKVFNTSPELTYSVFAGLGIVLLIISFYVDRQAFYNHQEILKYEHKAREDFIKLIREAEQKTYDLKKDSNTKIDNLTTNVNKILNISEETRRDTLRIQLLMILEQHPDNVDTILKLAETYFVELHGDWYMSSEFNKWAKAHNIIVPSHIFQAIDNNHKQINK